MKGDRLFYGWVVVGAGLIVWILEPGMYASFGVFFKPIAGEMGWSRAMVSAAVSLTSVPLGVLAPISGALADRYGPRRLVIASGVLTGAGYSLLSRVDSLWQFYLFYLIVGLGMGIAFAPITATVIRWFDQKRGLALGITSVGTGIGGMIFPPLANQLISTLGWRSSYLLLGSLMGVAVVLAGTLLRRDPGGMGLSPYGVGEEKAEAAALNPHRPTPAADFSLRQAVRTSAYWTVFFAAAAAVFSFVLMQVHLVPYATDRGLTPATAAAIMAVMGLGNSLGRLGLGALSDRVGRKRMLFTVLVVSGFTMLLFTTAGTAWMFYLFALIFGLAYGGALVCWFGLPGELFGLASVGAIIGLTQTGSNLGGASGSFIAGYIFDVTGSYSAAFFTAAVILFLAGGLVLFLKQPQQRELGVNPKKLSA